MIVRENLSLGQIVASRTQPTGIQLPGLQPLGPYTQLDPGFPVTAPAPVPTTPPTTPTTYTAPFVPGIPITTTTTFPQQQPTTTVIIQPPMTVTEPQPVVVPPAPAPPPSIPEPAPEPAPSVPVEPEALTPVTFPELPPVIAPAPMDLTVPLIIGGGVLLAVVLFFIGRSTKK